MGSQKALMLNFFSEESSVQFILLGNLLEAKRKLEKAEGVHFEEFIEEDFEGLAGELLQHSSEHFEVIFDVGVQGSNKEISLSTLLESLQDDLVLRGGLVVEQEGDAILEELEPSQLQVFELLLEKLCEVNRVPAGLLVKLLSVFEWGTEFGKEEVLLLL